jgi:hypothetical protein
MEGWSHPCLEMIDPGKYFLRVQEVDFDAVTRKGNWYMFASTEHREGHDVGVRLQCRLAIRTTSPPSSSHGERAVVVRAADKGEHCYEGQDGERSDQQRAIRSWVVGRLIEAGFCPSLASLHGLGDTRDVA